MKRYQKFMDGVRASDTLHRRLVELKEPEKKPAAWMKYGTVAAALALVVGAGAWGLSGGFPFAANRDLPLTELHGEDGVIDQPDIAIVEPGDVTEPGEKTLGGYEVTTGSGPNAIVSYYPLPYIEYGEPSGISGDFSLAPPDGGLRGATREDALALVGGEDALTAHLNWGGCEFDGTVGFEADGTVWMMSLWGENEDTAFSLQLSPNRMPPTCCVVIGEPRTITNVWGVEVSGVKDAGAYGDAERGVYMDVSREVEFIANGVGCRLKAYGTQDEAVEELVSRFVRWAVVEGLNLSGISPDGAEPVDIDPNYSVGEPNWNDSGETSAYDPNELADRGINPGEAVPESDSFLTCRTCGGGVPDGTGHYCKADGSGGYVCALCGQAFPEGKVHSHEICGYPLAPGTYTCETCGESVPYGMAHDCAMCGGYPVPYVCEVCGQTLPAGVEHSHSCEVCGETLFEGVEHSHQEEHHQDHHGNHH